ncbi:polysaccharide deacetylase family protein [Egbenema bharatensis]|uniref:polysaccharide deacetylase family protein n=1 Tax=Egbenema bharatensis TaxID=3463334 RepID=UPI003A849339
MSMIVNKVHQAVSHLKNRMFPGALILMYHRIAEANSDPWSLCVTPKHFAEHLEILRDYGSLLHLKELTRKLDDRKSIHRSIVVTFDDGYADNFYYAKPLLEKYDVPATVFVTTGSIDQKHEFWWDELDRLLLQPGTLPESLQLDTGDRTYQWELGEAVNYSQADSQRDRHWRMEAGKDPTPRHALYRSLYHLFQFLPAHEQRQLLDEVRSWANIEPVSRSTHRSLSSEELVALGGELVEIGAHTVSHPFLAKLPIASQLNEIQQSKNHLEEILGYSVTSFSYPNGSYVSETIPIVQEAGFECACCSIADRVQPNGNHFLLPRVVVEDWDSEAFSRWLSKCFSV